MGLLHQKISGLKKRRELEESYMRFEELLQDSRAEGKAEGKVEGRVAGKRESVLELLTENGEVPKELRTLIESQTDTEILSRWLRLAAKSGSVEEFVSNM